MYGGATWSVVLTDNVGLPWLYSVTSIYPCLTPENHYKLDDVSMVKYGFTRSGRHLYVVLQSHVAVTPITQYIWHIHSDLVNPCFCNPYA